ncbi:hypothetical protein FBY35_2187 [Streptomyces sp. SLBN-118]|uniref:hypothetical protein n=1 Tax=Streptomyces sp. SLBN-118 TaxID=2768454 RepID=UPI00116AF3E0|nr:hypothetical protein [Streptomyces sp. SLBN-118]TQK51769.1 hypothetical protein FBY35_2187 [Streptomyces sp. SLBN-118]
MQERLALHPVPVPMRGRSPWTTGGRPLPWLLTVAVAFTAAQLILVVPGSGLGWDETVYVSQVGGNAPPAYFSAPRARGISYLVAPVASLTASTTAIRVYLALLSGAGLFACLWIWRRLVPVAVLGGAGAVFAGLWITVFYGPQAMPNLWCALGALAAVGWFLRAVPRPGERRAVAGAGCAVAVVVLMRPSDGLWLALPLAAAALLVPGRRRPAVFAAVVIGFLLGAVPWVVEAYAHYGGLGARLHRASEIQGGLGWHLAVDDQVRALDGRSLCRPCDVPWKHPVAAAWWFALPVLTAGGIWAALRADRDSREPWRSGSPPGPRTHRGAAALLATFTAAALSVPYLFLIEYAAPRFLLPAYALLSLPVAECLVFLSVFLVTAVRPSLRPVGAGVLALALTGHLAVQYGVLRHMLDVNRSLRAHYSAIATGLHRLGVRPPCMVSGHDAVPIAYYAGCASRQSGGHDASITSDGIVAATHRMPVAVVVAGGNAPPAYARTWRTTALPHVRGRETYRVYLPPTLLP